MTMMRVGNVRIAGICSAVPGLVKKVCPPPDDPNSATLIDIAGVRTIRVAQEGVCTSDLCCAAAQRLISGIGWTPESIGALIFVTQTPDYVLPATSTSLQHRLGLADGCAAFDVNLGCSGYIYGLWLGSLIVSAGVGKVMLLVGDTLSKLCCNMDRTTALFGDAGTATALEYCENATGFHLELCTDGAGRDNLVVPAGGFRWHRSSEPCIRQEREKVNKREPEHLYMNSTGMFAFASVRVPPLIASLLKRSGWSDHDVSAYVFTQGSVFGVQTLARRMNLPIEKVSIGLEGYGSTSSASIPLTLTTQLGERLRNRTERLILVGFGAGYSWGGAAVECGPMWVPDVVAYEPSA